MGMGRVAGVIVAVMLLAAAQPSVAQAQDTPGGFVGALGGLTFGTVTSGAVAGQGGVEVAPGLFVIGEVGYMRNVLPKELRDEIDEMADLLSLIYEVPVDVRMSVPAVYGFGGLRWTPGAGAIVPFVEGGVGVGHISLRIDEADVMGVDFSELIEDELDGDDTNATKFLVALGGGVTVRPSRSLAVDLGFRYTRIATEDPVINSSMAYGAVKVGF
jgi:hypothetical protein